MTTIHRITVNGLIAVIVRTTYGKGERVTASLETTRHTPLETREFGDLKHARKWAERKMK